MGSPNIASDRVPPDIASSSFLLDHLPSAHRFLLRGHAEQIHAAIEQLNEKDPYGKACCWLGVRDAPAFGMEQLVQRIAQHDLGQMPELSGYEWWLQVRKAHTGIDFHHDTNWNDAMHDDNEDGRSGTRLTFPLFSSVTYLSDVGGPTVLLVPSNLSSSSISPLNVDPAEYGGLLNRTLETEAATILVSYPEWGKHLRFRGNLYHGVLDAVARPPAARRAPRSVGGHRGPPPAEETRMTLVVTYWEKPYRHIQRFPRESFLRRLSKQACIRVLPPARGLAKSGSHMHARAARGSTHACMRGSLTEEPSPSPSPSPSPLTLTLTSHPHPCSNTHHRQDTAAVPCQLPDVQPAHPR